MYGIRRASVPVRPLCRSFRGRRDKLLGIPGTPASIFLSSMYPSIVGGELAPLMTYDTQECWCLCNTENGVPAGKVPDFEVGVSPFPGSLVHVDVQQLQSLRPAVNHPPLDKWSGT